MKALAESKEHVQAWQMVLGHLKPEMAGADYETWVKSLKPLGFTSDSVSTFRVGAANAYARDWVNSRLNSTISHILTGLYARQVRLDVIVDNGFFREDAPTPRTPIENMSALTKNKSNGHEQNANPERAGDDIPQTPKEPASRNKRKIMLEMAYGSERARIIQPDRGILLTNYFLDNWTPIIGHSAKEIIVAARRMCYWNVGTGEKRNIIETDMSILANKAHLSVRTVKSVLKNEIVKKYFLRYRVRRVMTANGVRTAGIILQVRMDDPLTPEDQKRISVANDDVWYSAGFEDGSDEELDDSSENSSEYVADTAGKNELC